MGTTVSSMVLEKEEMGLSDFTRLHSLLQAMSPDDLFMVKVQCNFMMVSTA